MKALLSQIENAIAKASWMTASQYIVAENTEGERVTIRVANHAANPSRMSDWDISLVVELPEEDEDDSYSSFSVNKKTFSSLPNQYIVNENGEFSENFTSIEEMLEYHEIAK